MLSLRSAWSRAVVSGFTKCTSQAGAILPPEQGSAKGTVPVGTAPWARTPLGRKSALFEANEAALRGSQRWPAGPSPLGIRSGCPPCAAPQWHSYLCRAVYDTRHLPRSRRGSRSALPRIASRICETSGLSKAAPREPCPKAPPLGRKRPSQCLTDSTFHPPQNSPLG